MKTSILTASVVTIAISLSACASGPLGKQTTALTKEEGTAHLSQRVPVGHKQDQAMQKDLACAEIVKK